MFDYELKPCPFCGGAVTIVYDYRDMAYCIHHLDPVKICAAPDILIPFERCDNFEGARLLWNTRV